MTVWLYFWKESKGMKKKRFRSVEKASKYALGLRQKKGVTVLTYSCIHVEPDVGAGPIKYYNIYGEEVR